jgi:NitT/TauT family transport system ATP-binding protein
MTTVSTESTAESDLTYSNAGRIFDLSGVGVELGAKSKRRSILTDVSFTVATGEIVGILGPSGTGKTTLLKLLGGLLRPTSGTVLLDGEPVSGPTPDVITVFQDYSAALLPWRTVCKNVGLPLEAHCSKEERNTRVNLALSMVGLENRQHDYPNQLSGGMQQRVQIARALVVQPRVMLMDEPFGALDAITKATLQDQLLSLQRQTRATVVFITHDVEEAVYLADRVIVVHSTPGRIIHEVVTDLPRPRDQLATRELSRYHEIRHELVEKLRSGDQK